MRAKRLILIALAALMALSTFGMAAAQREHGPWTQRRPRPVLNGLRHAVAVVSEATGLDRAEIATALRDGKSLTDVITDNGVEVAAVKAALKAPLAERLTTAVDSGRITQERADAILARIEEAADRLLNHTFERLAERERPLRRRYRPATEL